MREKLLTVLLVPVLVLPVVVIAAGGDLEIVWHELTMFWRAPIQVMVYAQLASPTATVVGSPTATFTLGPSPTLTLGPSPTLTMGPGPGPTRPAPLLTRWANISLSIFLALFALWSLSRPASRKGEP